MAQHLLDVRDLCISFVERDGSALEAVNKLNLHIDVGEIVGVVGESGCGKSVFAQSVMRLLEHEQKMAYEGQILFDGEDLLARPLKTMREVRGCDIAMIFQDPLSSLNPVMTVGAQVVEAVRAHRKVSRRDARAEALSLLERVGIRDAGARFDMYPSDFSGGMRQRAMIAMALAGYPRLLIADEPTTALDTTTQKQILDLLRDLNRTENMAVLFISHDLGVVTSICSRVHVMYLGQIVEEIDACGLMERPSHPYARGSSRASRRLRVSGSIRWRIFRVRCRRSRQYPVVAALRLVARAPRSVATRRSHRSLPRARATDRSVGLSRRGSAMAANSEALLKVSHLTKTYPMSGSGFKRQVFTAVDDLSFEIAPGEVYGLVGESGSGKSTTGRLICGLEHADSGSIIYRGHDLAAMSERERKPYRREIQLVFQDSSTAFDPRNRVGRILEEPLIIAGVRDADERHERALSALASVGLLPEHYDRYPHDLSGGQRQRLNLARALICEPCLVVCDEPVSALDVSVQAQVLNLLRELQRTTGVALLFITHDMRVVRHMSDRIGVLYHGRLVEEGAAEEVIAHPSDPYTQALIDAIP